MNTILVATDFSNAASNAVTYAANLAKALNVRLEIFHSYHINTHASNTLLPPEDIDHLYHNVERRLQILTDDITLEFGIDAGWICKKGSTVEELDAYTRSSNPSLVVMGIESNLREYKLFGNTTTSVIRLRHFPVLVVPDNAKFDGIEMIMYACDPSHPGPKDNLSLLEELATTVGAQLQMLQVDTKMELEQLAEEEIVTSPAHRKSAMEYSYAIIGNPNVTEGIRNGINAFHPDLLVMIPRKPGLLKTILRRSNTRNVAVRTRVPLLALPN